MDAARQNVLAAAELAREAGDGDALAQASLVMEGMSDVLWDARGRAICEEALAALPDEDSAVRARLLAQRVVADSWRFDLPADAPSRAALAMAERVGDRRAIVEALRARQIACGGPEGAEERVALGDRLLAIGRAADGDDATLWGHLWRFDAYCQLGELDLAEAECEPIDATADRMRSPLARWHAVRSRSAITLVRGRFADAAALGRQALALAERAGHAGALQPSIGLLLMARAQTGDPELVPDELIDKHAAGITALRTIYAGWMLILGRREEARRLYRSQPSPTDVPRFVLLSALGGAAELAAEFDDRERAAEAYELLTPFADRFVCGGVGVVAILGSVRLSLGIAAATTGRLDDAAGHLRAAVEIHERAGSPPYAAWSRYHLASVLARRRTGDREEAAGLAAAALAKAAELGMTPLHTKASELVESLAGRTAGPLTRREREIAGLVSQGLSNRQIAATAFISERTVETHVQHILGKLGFTARTQIAAWVVEEKMRTGSP
jgi:DNA-binding CsgD family transcriptional regulator